MGPLIAIAFLVVPVVEIYVLVQTGQEIGVLPTIGLMLLVSAAGAWLVAREGRRAWGALRLALHEQRVPAREVLDGAIVVFAGAFLLTPGFVSDAFGLLLLLPPTRAVIRRLATRWVAKRVVVVRDRSGTVVEGEVLPPRDEL